MHAGIAAPDGTVGEHEPTIGPSGSPSVGPATPRAGIRAIVWQPDGKRMVDAIEDVEAALADPDCHVWVDVEGADDVLVPLIARLGLHDLVADDIVSRDKRAKIVLWDDAVQVVMFMVELDGDISTMEVDMVLGRQFLLTAHPESWHPFDTLRTSVHRPSALLGEGADMVLYALIDAIVSAYFPIIDRIGDEIDELESAILATRDERLLERLVRARRWLLELRHVVDPVRDILDQLSERDIPVVDAAHRVYFRHAWGQVIHVADQVDTQREIAHGVLDAYLSGVNNSLAEVMKRLTAITAVLAGVGAAAGIFGMSEAGAALGLPSREGFWLVALVAVLVGAFVFAYFRRIDWI